MVRYLDYNDSYISVGSGHPSDMVPACLAVAEAYGCSGRDTLVAIVAAYEVFATLADVVQLRERGGTRASSPCSAPPPARASSWA